MIPKSPVKKTRPRHLLRCKIERQQLESLAWLKDWMHTHPKYTHEFEHSVWYCTDVHHAQAFLVAQKWNPDIPMAMVQIDGGREGLKHALRVVSRIATAKVWSGRCFYSIDLRGLGTLDAEQEAMAWLYGYSCRRLSNLYGESHDLNPFCPFRLEKMLQQRARFLTDAHGCAPTGEIYANGTISEYPWITRARANAEAAAWSSQKRLFKPKVAAAPKLVA